VRRSLGHRLQAVLEAADRIDPRAVALHRLAPELRLRYDAWLRECEQAWRNAERQYGGRAEAFEASVDDRFNTPNMPRAVAKALRVADPPVLTDDMSEAECAEVYRAYAEW